MLDHYNIPGCDRDLQVYVDGKVVICPLNIKADSFKIWSVEIADTNVKSEALPGRHIQIITKRNE